MLFADFVKWILKKIIFFKSTYIDAIRNEVSRASGGVWKLRTNPKVCIFSLPKIAKLFFLPH